MTVSDARRYTRTALDKRINEQVTYEAKIVDLENVPGMENKKIRFGDTIRIKDEKFNPPLYLEARIFEQTRSITSNAKRGKARRLYGIYRRRGKRYLDDVTTRNT